MKERTFITFFLLLTVFCLHAGERIKITDMRCEYLTSPLGIDECSPRFIWTYKGQVTGFTPAGCRIEVAESVRQLRKHQGVAIDGHTANAPMRYTGKPLKSHTRYYWQVTVTDTEGRKHLSPVGTFEMGKLKKEDWQAQWISDGQNRDTEPAPLFRKLFTIQKPAGNARLYVSATGYYELFINGQRVGDHHMDPGFTHFDKRSLYVTHDVSSLLRPGENVIAAVLGNGFYNVQSRASWNFENARWRNRPALLCELRMTSKDGTVQTIGTDDSWQTATGPYLYNNLYSGDWYDARLEQKGWNDIGFQTSGWTGARIVPEPAPLLVAQSMPAICPVEEIRPVSMQSFGDSIYVFDMGKNIAGVCRLRVSNDAPVTYTLQHGELLKPDGRLQPGNVDVYFYPERPGEKFQTDIFTSRGEGHEEQFSPQFTYHGFRYVEVRCTRPANTANPSAGAACTAHLTQDNLTGLFMHTDLPRTGNFSCSNPLLNKIYDATMLSYCDNLYSIPTDCPQREKNGWTADAYIAIDLALRNFDGITLYEKWMNDFIDNQRPDGSIAGIIPTYDWGYGDFPGPVWDAALFIIPDALYQYYADTRCIERLYPTMLRYLDYIRTKETEDGGLANGLGDWVYWKAQTPTNYTSTLFYYLDYKRMARFATLLGKDATPFHSKAEQLKQLLNRHYFNSETGIYANGTQTAQALALHAGIVPSGKEQLVADRLHDVVASNNYFLDFGLLGSRTVPDALARYGYVEDVYKMMTKTDAPSWGYWVETQGYTTLAETWTLSPEFKDASINHVFMGDISAWMSRTLAGIRTDESQPGFRHIVIRPMLVKGLDRVKSEYQSVCGLISSQWERKGTTVSFRIKIPVGCTASVYIEDKHYEVGGGEHIYTFPAL